jgi:YggT family protein
LLDVVVFVLQIYWFAVIAWIILSWIPVSSDHPLGRLSVMLDRITYPIILPLRRVLPPLRLGGAMLDLSPIVLLIGIQILIGILT